MVSSVLMLTLLVFVVKTRASHYTTAPQYTWATRQGVPPALSPNSHIQQNQYYSPSKGQVSGRGYTSAPGFWNGGASKGETWNYNRVPVSAYAAGIYKNDRADRPSYLSGPSASGSNTATEGRVSGKALAAGGYSRYISNQQEPLHSRYGSFTFSPPNSQAYGGYGNYRSVGFYGSKSPSAPSYPLSGGQPPLNLQAFRGSRIYEGPVGAKYNQTKKTGVYVIPTPAKLYYDGVKN